MRLRLVVAAACVVLITTLFAAVPDARAQGGCSLATLRGSFGAVEQFTVIMAMQNLPAPPYPSAGVAVWTYDGAGNMTATMYASFGGVPYPTTVAGTYTVNPDCTYADLVPNLARRRGTITGEGMTLELHTIFTTPWNIGSGSRKKMPAGQCSARTVKGSYALVGQGNVMDSNTQALVPIAHVGIVNFDGHGTLDGSETLSAPGTPVATNTFTGTYEVNSDCTTSAEIHSSSGLVLHQFGVIVGEGTRQEVRTIVKDAGWVLADSIKRQ